MPEGLVISNSRSFYSTIWTDFDNQPLRIDAHEPALRPKIADKVEVLEVFRFGRLTETCDDFLPRQTN